VVEQPDFDRVVKLLEAEGRALTPPPGALQRVIARAAAPRQRPQGAWMRPWMRPALAALTVAVLLVGLSGGAYASTPGQPLFNVQRALDDAYLALPRSPQAAAHASIGVAERRVAQATNVKAKVSEDTLRATLADALRHFSDARAAVARLPEGQRQQQSRALAASERTARDRLIQARHESNGQNNNVLDEITSVLEHEAQHDADDGQQGPGTQERGPAPQQPGSSGSDQSPERGSSQNNTDSGTQGEGGEGTRP
jgi:hypothetical protein